MVSTRELAELAQHAARARTRLVLVGDYHQLPEIDAGGAFRALAARVPAIELTQNRRQAARWERDALALLRDGDVHAALDSYERHGRVVASDRTEDVRARLVADWWRANDPEAAVMIAFRRADVADLNGRARALMRAAGALGEAEIALPGGSFAAGDRVVLRRNDPRLGVANGDRGIVTRIDKDARGIDVQVAERRLRLDAEYLSRTSDRAGPTLAHGYAITGHAAQGLTCDEAFVLVTSEASREWAYTALSRGRRANRIYAVAAEFDDRAEFAPSDDRQRPGRDVVADAFGRTSAQRLATEHARELER